MPGPLAPSRNQIWPCLRNIWTYLDHADGSSSRCWVLIILDWFAEFDIYRTFSTLHTDKYYSNFHVYFIEQYWVFNCFRATLPCYIEPQNVKVWVVRNLFDLLLRKIFYVWKSVLVQANLMTCTGKCLYFETGTKIIHSWLTQRGLMWKSSWEG